MYFIQRAIKYLTKKKGKTFLLMIMFLIIANLVLAGLLVQNASQKAQDNTRISIGADVIYELNFEKFFSAANKGVLEYDELVSLKTGRGVVISEAISEGGGPTYSNFVKLIDSDYVESYDFGLTFSGLAENYQIYHMENNRTNVNQNNPDNSRFSVKIHGGYVPQDFIEGNAVLKKGRMATKEEMEQGTPVVLIEESVANLNQIKIGDVMNLTYSVIDNEEVEIEHEVIGIYRTTEGVNQSTIKGGDDSQLPQNKLYVPFFILHHIGYSDDQIDDLLLTSNLIKLNDPLNTEAFKEEANEIIDFKYGRLNANDELYNNLIGPIESLGLISKVLVAIIIVTGGLIIGLITALTVNDRKGEIGILLAVGETKMKIVKQFVLEVVIIAIIAFSLSLFTGSYIGEEISDSILDSDLFDTMSQDQQYTKGKVQNISKNAVEAPKMDISIAPVVLAQLFAMGVALTVVSTMIPTLYVMRFNPKQILISRNS